MFRDINGKISRKAVAAYFLIINGVALVWYATIRGSADVLPFIVTLITSGTALLTATIGEKKTDVKPTANSQ